MPSMLKEVFQIDQVPDHFKEPFIISGYRNPKSSLLQCIGSIFCATNETFNFWTHILPAFFFCYKTTEFVQTHELNDAYGLPMLTYMITLCLFPFTSAIAHVFNTMSDRARHICFFLDYYALSQYSVGAAVAYRAYMFPDDFLGGFFHSIYLYLAILCGMLSLVISCQSRFMAHGLQKKILRICAYAIPYFYASIPCFHRLYACLPEECADHPAMGPHTRQFFYAGLSVALYLCHWPERSFPGKFDVLGHSHQLFHIFSAYAAYLQMTGLSHDYVHRKDYLHLHNDFLSVTWSISLFVLLGSINVLILLYFVCKLSYVTQGSECWEYLYACGVNVNGCHRDDLSDNRLEFDENVNSKHIGFQTNQISAGGDCNISKSDDIVTNGIKKSN